MKSPTQKNNMEKDKKSALIPLLIILPILLAVVAIIVVKITVFSKAAPSTVVAFETQGLLGSEVTINATTNDPNLGTVVLSRGSGVGIPPSPPLNAYSASSYVVGGTKSDAISNNEYFQLSISPNATYLLSLDSLDMTIRRSATGPNAYQWQYSLDGFATPGVDLGAEGSYTGTDASGKGMPQIDLSGVSELQLVPSGSTVTLRLYAWGATYTAGTFAIGRLTGDDLQFVGEVNIITHELTYTADSNGSISGATPQTVNYGSDGSPVEAVANPGYHFVSWSDSSTTNPRVDTNITNDLSVTATFAENSSFHTCGTDKMYYDGYGYTTVEIGTQCWFDENLRYLPNVVGSATGSRTTPYSYVYGYEGTDVITAKMTANYATYGALYNAPSALTACPTGWKLPSDDDFKTMELSLGMSQADVDNTDWRGTTEGAQLKSDTLWNGTNLSGYGAVPAGYRQSSQFNGLATENYLWTSSAFDGDNNWARALDSSVTTVRRLSYDKELGFSVRCLAEEYTLTYTAGAHGSISGTNPQTVTYGSDGTEVTAVPETGYTFVDWSDGSTANPRTDMSVQGNVSVTANFAIKTYSLKYVAGSHGSLTGSATQTIDHGSSGTEVTAVPETGYAFVNWSDGSTANPRTDTNVTANLTVTASFALKTYSLNYTAKAHGSISGVTSQTVDHGSDGTEVTAVPETGYAFVDWSDGSTTNPRIDKNVTDDLLVTADFAILTFSLSYRAESNGTISGTSSQTVEYGSDGSSVTAVPKEGYDFTQWSDGKKDNPRTDKNVVANLTVTAEFSTKQIGGTSVRTSTGTKSDNLETIQQRAQEEGEVASKAAQQGVSEEEKPDESATEEEHEQAQKRTTWILIAALALIMAGVSRFMIGSLKKHKKRK